jgi:hypothetical protein
VPAAGQLVDEFCDRVSDLGVPISEEGIKLCEKLDEEEDKRTQDMLHMHIYNDWNGWGMSECLENFVCRTWLDWNVNEEADFLPNS